MWKQHQLFRNTKKGSVIECILRLQVVYGTCVKNVFMNMYSASSKSTMSLKHAFGCYPGRFYNCISSSFKDKGKEVGAQYSAMLASHFIKYGIGYV